MTISQGQEAGHIRTQPFKSTFWSTLIVSMEPKENIGWRWTKKWSFERVKDHVGSVTCFVQQVKSDN